MDDGLYETDSYTLTQSQAEHLRAGRLHCMDLNNIAEKIESLGKSQAAGPRSAYRLIAMHPLKTTLQPSKTTKSWRSTLVRERLNAEDWLSDGPGLKPRRADLFDKA